MRWCVSYQRARQRVVVGFDDGVMAVKNMGSEERLGQDMPPQSEQPPSALVMELLDKMQMVDITRLECRFGGAISHRMDIRERKHKYHQTMEMPWWRLHARFDGQNTITDIVWWCKRACLMRAASISFDISRGSPARHRNLPFSISFSDSSLDIFIQFVPLFTLGRLCYGKPWEFWSSCSGADVEKCGKTCSLQVCPVFSYSPLRALARLLICCCEVRDTKLIFLSCLDSTESFGLHWGLFGLPWTTLEIGLLFSRV